MYPSEEASLKAVKEALKDVDSVCERCMLRFAGIKNSRVHLAVADLVGRNGLRWIKIMDLSFDSYHKIKISKSS